MFLILLLVSLIITSMINATPVNHPNRIAIASQGKAESMLRWVQTYSKMNSSAFVTLFLLSYDQQIPPDVCLKSGSVCIYRSHSTWTSGRNALLKSVYNFETQAGNRHLFKYIAFADDDMIDANCTAKVECEDERDKTACCFDSISYFLLSSVSYAVVNFVNLGGVTDPTTNEYVNGVLKIAHADCSDGAFNAYHRAAVPALLPYVELVDPYSWWGAQAIMWTVISGCVPGYSVYVGIFDILRTSGHVNYPKGRYDEVESDAKEAVFGKKGLSPWPIDIKASYVQGNCAKISPFMEHTHEAAWKSGNWLKTDAFHQCHKTLKFRYEEFVSGAKNYSDIDYIDFGSYNTKPIPPASNKLRLRT